MSRYIAFIVGMAGLMPLSLVQAQPLNPEGIEFFEQRIRPVLVEHCYKCHSTESDSPKGGLLLETRAGLRRGGDSGHAVVPNDVDESLIVSALKHDSFEMPPAGPLDESIIADFEKWINMGAPDPRNSPTAEVQSSIDLEKGREFWAFQPIQTTPPPETSDRSWALNEIDQFVLAKLEQAGLRPVHEADRQTLIRRLSYDLLGLPPTPQEIDEFVNDASDDAYQQLVERMLQSAHFGERWGRHWLDVVRYAESMGKTRNYPFPFAWRYRDYVIRSINADKPYNQFLTEQLAGDLLPAESDEQRDEQLIATAFLALGSHDLNQNDRAAYTMDVVGEQIDVTSRSLMGLTLACARCHDHKFDPIPTHDYYAIAGIFRSTSLLNGYQNKRRNNNYQSEVLFHQLLTAKDTVNSRALTADQNSPARPAIDDQADLKQFEKARRIVQNLRRRLKEIEANSELAPQERRSQADPLRRELQQKQKRFRALKARLARATNPQPNQGGKRPGGPLAMGVRDADRRQDCQIHIRGDVKRLGPTVSRGFLQVIQLDDAAAIPQDTSGRLQLAQWLTRPDHPLTSRVMANRVWHHLFGMGIVRTVDNFGFTGERPSHPELLDYLAHRFMQEGWSVKQLIRSIVLSRTYRLSSDHDERNFEVDPDNRLLWRMNRRRLEAEAIRDAVLFVSGSLQSQPPTGSIVQDLAIKELGRRQKVQSDLVDDVHRTIYVPIVRSKVPGFLTTFDFPEPSEVKGRRDVTTVPTQALFMMNSPLVRQHARATAEQLLKEDMDDEPRLQLAYRRALGREATVEQAQRALEHIRQSSASDPSSTEARLDGWTDVLHALLASSEFRYRD